MAAEKLALIGEFTATAVVTLAGVTEITAGTIPAFTPPPPPPPPPEDWEVLLKFLVTALVEATLAV